MNKLVKVGLVGLLAIGVVGCASIGGMSNHYVNDVKKEGILYGVGLDARDINEVCDAIKNKDNRCLERDKYQSVAVCSRFGYADGFTGTFALAPKELDIGEPCRTGSSKCTYLKTLVEKGKLGTVLEVASRPGDGKCRWGGMPRIGSTVCDIYNYDASKNFNGMPR